MPKGRVLQPVQVESLFTRAHNQSSLPSHRCHNRPVLAQRSQTLQAFVILGVRGETNCCLPAPARRRLQQASFPHGSTEADTRRRHVRFMPQAMQCLAYLQASVQHALLSFGTRAEPLLSKLAALSQSLRPGMDTGTVVNPWFCISACLCESRGCPEGIKPRLPSSREATRINRGTKLLG